MNYKLLLNTHIKKFLGIISKKIDFYSKLENLRKLGKVYGVLNVIVVLIFFIWYANFFNLTSLMVFVCLLIGLLWIVGGLFLIGASRYAGSKWMKWAWLSLIFIFPWGLVLLFFCHFPIYWEIEEKTIDLQKTHGPEEKTQVFSESLNEMEKKWKESLKELRAINETIINSLLTKALLVESEEFKDWKPVQINVVVSMALSIKQYKQKDFDNFLWQPFWYDNRRFTFAIKNTKSVAAQNKYAFSFAVIVLDEFNNYEKIMTLKDEIKKNLKFSPAKIICLHWGKSYKVYVNE